jgi:hypothetical protein
VASVLSGPAPPIVTLAKKAPKYTKAELQRREKAKKVAAFRREHPATLSNAEKVANERLIQQGVNALATCLYETKKEGKVIKTANYDCAIVKIKHRPKKDGTFPPQQFRMKSKCRNCHRAKSTIVKGTSINTVTGGGIIPPHYPSFNSLAPTKKF